MARTNAKPAYRVETHEGGPAFPHMTPEQALRRSVMSCLLWEREFYEDGQSIADRIMDLAQKVAPTTVANMAVEARHKMNLRHAPLMLLVALCKTGAGTRLVSDTIAEVVSRGDEPGELLSLYWKINGKDKPLSKQLKLGLATALRKFSPYALAKYNRDADVKLRDVLFLVHAKPKDDEQAATWKQLVDGSLASPDTWEVALSGGADKKATFERLMREGQLGYLALLRNLRNMEQAGVDPSLMRAAIVARKGAERVLPFRYVAAARACPQMEPALDEALSEAIADMPSLPGRTAVLVDVSGSMDEKLSAKSDMTRLDAAAALASLINGNVRMFSFSNQIVEVPPRRGMAGVDAIRGSQPHGGTRLFDAVAALNDQVPYDRLIVITDEQATGNTGFGIYNRIQGTLNTLPDPKATGYMVNVASAKNGVGYGKWLHLDGWSENIIRYIGAHEAR
jgi:60 kDa SS-A/Ro ribonucleoprotein